MNYNNLTKEKLIKLQSDDNVHNKGINIVWRSRYGLNFPYKLNSQGSIENCILGALVGDREMDTLILQQANRLRDERMMKL